MNKEERDNIVIKTSNAIANLLQESDCKNDPHLMNQTLINLLTYILANIIHECKKQNKPLTKEKLLNNISKVINQEVDIWLDVMRKEES